MTNQEASKVIKDGLEDMSLDYFDEEQYEALTMAISALSQEPSGDLISRQAVINLIRGCNNALEEPRIFDSHNSGVIFEHYITKLSSVNPQEPKTGHWITQWNIAHQKEYYYCSECREEFSYDGETGIKMNDYDYCPNCGCRMVEPQESEDEE